MERSDDQFGTLSARALIRGLWRLPWLCAVQIAYDIPHRFVAWVGTATTGDNIRYT